MTDGLNRRLKRMVPLSRAPPAARGMLVLPQAAATVCDEVERPAPTASSAKTWSLLERHKGGTVP